MKNCPSAVMLICAFVASMPADVGLAQVRTWSDATGSFSVDAEFVDLVEGKVRLKRADGQTITVELKQLSAADQEIVKGAKNNELSPVAAGKLAGETRELKNDDGIPAGKKSFPRGIAALFKATEKECYLTSIRVHGGRYGSPQPPKEDFHVSICDKQFKLIADFTFPYATFKRSDPDWVSLRLKPTRVPEEFIICLNFNPESTKGVYVSHDAEGKSLVGLPDKPAGTFTGGDWMIRPTIDTPKKQ